MLEQSEIKLAYEYYPMDCDDVGIVVLFGVFSDIMQLEADNREVTPSDVVFGTKNKTKLNSIFMPSDSFSDDAE